MKVLIYIFVVIIVILGAGYLLLSKTTYLNFLNNWFPKSYDCCIKDETVNWKTYRNERYGFVFKYPSTWCIGSSTQMICNSNNPEILLNIGRITDIPKDLEVGLTRPYLENLNGAIERGETNGVLFNGGKGTITGLDNYAGGGNNPIYSFLAVRGDKYVNIQVTDVDVHCPPKKLTEFRICESYFNKIFDNIPNKIEDPAYKNYNIFLEIIQKTFSLY